MAWTVLGTTNLGPVDVQRRGIIGETYCAKLTGVTAYTSFTKLSAVIYAVEYQGGTNSGATTEAMAAAGSVNLDNGLGAAGQTLDQILSATTTMASGTRTIRTLPPTHTPNGFGATLGNSTDTVLVWFRYA